MVMTFHARNILILLALAIDLFRRSCKLRSVRNTNRPAIPTVSLARQSHCENGLRGKQQAVIGEDAGIWVNSDL
jgi:hypothetical protein